MFGDSSGHARGHWLAPQPEKISKKARTAIEDASHSGQGMGISDIALLEISTLERKAVGSIPVWRHFSWKSKPDLSFCRSLVEYACAQYYFPLPILMIPPIVSSVLPHW